MRFILLFQAFQFISFSSLVRVILLSMIGTRSINGTAATTMALAGAGVVSIAGAWASPTGVSGAGVRGLAVPTRALPWFDIEASDRG